MIIDFKCKHTQQLWVTGKNRRFPPEIIRVALRKLLVLDSADSVDDLILPPSNHLERLYGDRLGFYSIRVNIKWRLCFVWKDNAATEVEIVDYH